MSAQTTTIIAQKGSPRATFAAAYLAVTLAQITNALPGALNGAFQQEFHTTGSELTWIAAIFMIGIVAFELTFGVLGDLYGRRRLLYAGFIVVAAGSLIAALAPTAQVMILAQAVGGIGAGILFPISLSMIAALAPDPKSRARTIATWAGFLSLGAVISPVLAGFTAQFFTTPTFDGWRLAYYSAVLIAIVAFVIAIRSVDSSAPKGRKLDIPGQVTLALGLIGVLYATVEGSEGNWARWDVVAGYILGGLLLVAFVVIESRVRVPLVHLSLFRNPSYSLVGIVAVVGMFAFLATCFATSISVGALAQQETWKVGVLFVFIQGPAFALIPVVAWLIHRVSPRWVLTSGFVVMAAAGYILSTFRLGVPEEFGGAPWTAFIGPLLLLGVGFALTVGSITAVALNTVPESLIGMASATTNLLRDLGFALGAVLGGAIAFSLGNAAFAAAFPQLAAGLGVPEPMIAELSHVPPVGLLSTPEAQNAIAEAAGPDAVGQVLGLAASSLGSGFSVVYLVAGIAATVSAMLTLFVSGKRIDAPLTDDELARTAKVEAV